MAFDIRVQYHHKRTEPRIEGNTLVLPLGEIGSYHYESLLPRFSGRVLVAVMIKCTWGIPYIVTDWYFFQPERCEWDDLDNGQKIAAIAAYQGWEWGHCDLLPWKDEPELVTLAVLGAL